MIQEVIKNNENGDEKIINWDHLQSINADIIGWIEIEGTNINYPILKDNDLFYINHSFERKSNSSGSIFTINSFPFEEQETTLYGHNMKIGSMFSDISKFMKEDYLYDHLKFKIYTPENNFIANIFSIYSIGIETEENNIKNLNFTERIEYYKKKSKYNIEVEKDIDKIVKLTTCSYINAKTSPTDQRYYLIARLDKI